MGSSSVEGLGAIRSHKPAGLRPESLESLRQGLDELRQPVSDHAAGEERDLLGDVLAGLGVTHRAHQVHDLRNVRCLEGEHPLVITQAVEADHHESELPPMRDRLTMARRVRGYVISGKHRTGTGTPLGGAGSATARERKALATMGRRGGQKAAQQRALVDVLENSTRASETASSHLR